jgi:arabinofuranosyltransferase
MHSAAAQTRTGYGTRTAVFGVLLAAAVFGAWSLELLLDDAFITFRYVSNARDGFGLVWNPPPFEPVEGYTSFLWAMLLLATWSWLGVEPPDAANVLSILCGLALLAITAKAALALRDRHGARVGDAVAYCTLAVVIGNRTFLQWMTSGLETALFNLGFALWVVLAFRPLPARAGRWLFGWAAAAAMVALTRPDGLLLVVTTVATALVSLARGERSVREVLSGLLPLLLVVAHVLWRLWFYGDWLPNTYHAKVGAPWPEAGLRYLLCFFVENGVWLAIAVAVTWLVVEWRRGPQALVRRFADNLPAVAAVSALCVQVGYYVLQVGGDTFEFRVLSHLIPIGTLGACAMAARLRAGSRVPIAVVLAIGLLSSGGWIQPGLTQPFPPPQYDAVGPHLPQWAQPLARWYDRHRLWLHLHYVAVRHGYDPTLQGARSGMPERRRTPFDRSDIPVVLLDAAGVPGWLLPDCAAIDMYGLSDWVAARTKASDWSLWWLPQTVLQAAVAAADADHDGCATRAELQAAFAAPGSPPESCAWFVEHLLLLFAEQRPDSLTAREVARIEPFVKSLRFMSHERRPPNEYVEAFDANVTIEGREVKVRKRAVPLTEERVRAIEREWREKIRSGWSPR